MQVYVDGVMLLNFLVDYLLLLGTDRLSGFPVRKKRLAAAAGLGAAYSGLCLLPELRFLGSGLWRLVFLGLMGSIAFGWSLNSLRRCGIFVLLSMALGGMAVCMGRGNVPALVLCAGGLWLLCRVAFDSPPGSREYVPLEIRYADRAVSLLALKDTGNTLRDPVTGRQALVISSDAACRLTGLTPRQLEHPLETLASGCLPGLRLLPFRTVGQGSGLMLAMQFSQVKLEGRQTKALVAFSPEGFCENSPFQALTGGVV